MVDGKQESMTTMLVSTRRGNFKYIFLVLFAVVAWMQSCLLWIVFRRSEGDDQLIHGVPLLVDQPLVPSNQTQANDDNHIHMWMPWATATRNHSTLCYDPGHDKVKIAPVANKRGKRFPITFNMTTMYREHQEVAPLTHGLFFLRPVKVGSSTAAGVNLHIAKAMAQRLGLTRQLSGGICDGSFHHTNINRLQFRNRYQSFLWSLVRDPTRRAVSEFFHFDVSREGIPATLDNFRDVSHRFRNFLLDWHKPARWKNTPKSNAIQDLLASFDFIGLTERFDETMVMLHMLLGVPLGDMLYLNAKTNGGYDDGASHHGCVMIVPSNLTSEWEDYFASEDWQDIIQLDLELFQAANRSLDTTIDHVIGRQRFAQQLASFRHAQSEARSQCLEKSKFPCTPKGIKRPRWDTDCLSNDMGCGFRCLEQVAANLSLLDISDIFFS